METEATTLTLGRLVATPGALESIHRDDMTSALSRHSRCDWGECSPDDKSENDHALREGFRILSVYRDRNGVKFWIITEADRSATTVLLPDEY